LSSLQKPKKSLWQLLRSWQKEKHVTDTAAYGARELFGVSWRVETTNESLKGYELSPEEVKVPFMSQFE